MNIYTTLLLFLSLSFPLHAEVVKNSHGEMIQLNSNGTWKKIKESNKSDTDPLKNNQLLVIEAKDGNDNPVKVNTLVKILESTINIHATKETVSQYIHLTSIMTKLDLKNEYSFVPRESLVTFDRSILEVYLKYTSKNDFGADVIGGNIIRYDLQTQKIIH